MIRIIGGKFKNRSLTSPKGKGVRPTSSRLREALFNICQQEIEGAAFLDLFGGSGAVGLEALSRGASHCLFADRAKSSVQIIKKNIETLGVTKSAEAIHQEAEQMLDQLIRKKRVFDIIFLDPPYQESELLNNLIATINKSKLLKEGGSLFIETGGEVEKKLPLGSLLLVSHRKLGSCFLTHYRSKL